MNRASVAELDQDRIGTVHHASEDEAIAARCDAPLLITASSLEAAEALARRVHAASGRRVSPFVSTRARALPIDASMLRATCADLMRTAAGGTLLLAAVEELPALVQDRLLDVLAELQSGRTRTASVRLIAGTTVSLFDRVAAGRFSEALFYRLNVVHLFTNETDA